MQCHSLTNYRARSSLLRAAWSVTVKEFHWSVTATLPYSLRLLALQWRIMLKEYNIHLFPCWLYKLTLYIITQYSSLKYICESYFNVHHASIFVYRCVLICILIATLVKQFDRKINTLISTCGLILFLKPFPIWFENQMEISPVVVK